MKRPRKPKMAKYPKLPKRSASLETMKNYQRRCSEVDKKNRDKVAAYNKKITDIATAKRLYESIRSRKNSRSTKVPHLKVA
jgi:hypothetical protein